MDDIKSAREKWLASKGGAAASDSDDTVQGIISAAWLASQDNAWDMAPTREQRLEIALTLAKERAQHAERERDMLSRTVANLHGLLQSRPISLDATKAVAAIMARADDDGAFHADAMIEVLRCLGAR